MTRHGIALALGFQIVLAAGPAVAAPAASKTAGSTLGPQAMQSPAVKPPEGTFVAQESLVRTALQRVPAIISARRTLEANRARLAAARGAYLPQVSLTAGISRSNQSNPTQAVSEPIDLEQASVGMHQELINFGKTAAQVDAARANVDISQGTVREQAVEVAHEVRRAYVTWVQARGLEDQARVQVQDDQRLYQQAQAFFKAGTRARLDVTRALTTLEQARASLLAAHTATDQARAALAVAIGDPASPVPFGHRHPTEGVPAFATVPAIARQSLDTLQTQALANHPTLAGAGARIALAHAGRESAEAADKPDLGADASFGGRARDLGGAPSWTVAMSLGWPLFNGGAFEQQRTAARLQEEAATSDLHNTEDQVILGVQNAYLAMQGAAARLPATSAELASAKENLYQAEGRYRAGVGSIIEVSDAQALLATAEADQLRAVAAYHLAIGDLIAAVGLTGTEP